MQSKAVERGIFRAVFLYLGLSTGPLGKRVARCRVRMRAIAVVGGARKEMGLLAVQKAPTVPQQAPRMPPMKPCRQ